MNPNEILPNPNLPEDSSEHLGYVTESAGSQRVEKKSGPGQDFSSVAASALSDDDDDQGGQNGQSNLGSAVTSSVAQVDAPENAEDLDLIEKEWVKKAKDIVHDTAGNPHKQANQINKMKVEYIKKRYNKDIKFKEE